MAKERISNALQELKAAIKEKRPERLYIFHGEEDFLLNYYLQQLKKLLIDDLTESFNFHRLNNESFDIQTFVTTWNQLGIAKNYFNSFISVAGSVVCALIFNGLLTVLFGWLEKKMSYFRG